MRSLMILIRLEIVCCHRQGGNSVGTELEGAIRRSYFIVGNLLMDDKIEAIQ